VKCNKSCGDLSTPGMAVLQSLAQRCIAVDAELTDVEALR